MNNNTISKNKQQNEILKLLSEDLDISESKYQEAEDRYTALGDWLNRKESKVAPYDPQIYVQGSFRLGTVIKPVTEEGEYDIDSVCELVLSKADITQKQLKELIGYEVKAYAVKMKKPAEEGKRCWTLNYADESRFHMDILPAVPDSESFRVLLEQHSEASEWTDSAISITDNTHPLYDVKSADWPISNPKGYAEWFKEQMRVMAIKYLTESEALMRKYASIEKVPVSKLKTPLQRIIQILKRHRDIKFDNSPDKPISIIITTLAAHSYNNEENIVIAMKNIVDNMLNYITPKKGELWIANPVNPLENFADKWPTHPQRQANFFAWHKEVQSYIDELLNVSKGIHILNESITKIAGENTAKAVMKRYGNNMANARDTGMLKAAIGTAALGVDLKGTNVLGHTFYGK